MGGFIPGQEEAALSTVLLPFSTQLQPHTFGFKDESLFQLSPRLV